MLMKKFIFEKKKSTLNQSCGPTSNSKNIIKEMSIKEISFSMVITFICNIYIYLELRKKKNMYILK